VVHANAHLESSLNLQAYAGALGGFSAPAIISSGAKDKPYQVLNDQYVCCTLRERACCANQSIQTDFAAASSKACDIQLDECQKAAQNSTTAMNSKRAIFNVMDCDAQKGMLPTRWTQPRQKLKRCS
jgi:hypothetical protein